MTGATTGVETLEFGRGFWPAVEGAGGGSPLAVLALDKAEITPRATGQRDGGEITLSPAGIRYATTWMKLPAQAPKANISRSAEKSVML